MPEDGIYKRLESLLSDSDPVVPDPNPAPPEPREAPVEPARHEDEAPAAQAPAPTVAEASAISEPPTKPRERVHTMEPVLANDREAPVISTFQRSPKPVQRIRPRPTRRFSKEAIGSLDPREWALSTQLAVIIILLVTGTIIAATIVTSRTVRNSLTNQIGSDFVVEAQGAVDQIRRYFLEKGGQIQTLSFSQTLADAVEAQNASYTGTPDEIIAGIEALDARWRTGGRGDPFILGVISQISDVSPAAHELHNFVRAFPDQAEVILTDRYGATVASNRLLSDYYQGDEAWWQAAWNNGGGGVYLSDPVFDESANVTGSVLAIPLTNQAGEVIGVLRTILVLEELYTRLSPTTVGTTRHTVLFDPEGNVLFDPREEDINSAGLAEIDRRQVSQFGVHFGFHTDQFGTDFILGTSQLDKPSTLDTFQNSQTQALADAISNLGWAAAVRQSSNEAFRSVDEVVRNISLVGAFAVLLSTIAGYLLARAINRPLLSLADSATQLGAGDLDVDLSNVRGTSEVRQVNRAFEAMAGQIRELLAGLELKVAERTRDLELAAEVGRNLSQLRDLDELLNEAVNRVGARFSLYYTQIYLADPSGQRLVLRAGTGRAGQTLIGRRHQLQIGPASINGRAAADRQPVIVRDTATSPIFLPNPLLPETRSEMAVPLVSGDRLLGVLDMQSALPGAFSDENLPAFEALAGQLAVAIENANLLAEAEEARAETAARVRQASRLNWETYLDAIDQREKLGYRFEDGAVQPWDGEAEDKPETALDVPLHVVGTQVGSLRVEDEQDRRWSSEESEIAQRVSEQLAAHIEDLRLLSEAERFRGQAEAAARRQTAGGWESYLSGGAQDLRFSYDGVQVSPESHRNGGGEDQRASLEQALAVLGVPIGELALWMDEDQPLDEEAADLVRSVSDRLSNHIENLRLSEQSARLLKELEENIARLEELDQLKSSFLANMSHELRTPLNSILGFTQVMQEGLNGPLTPQMDDDLATIRRNGNHLLHLIDDVLDMAKIEAGRMSLEPEQIALDQVLDEVIEITSPLADKKGLQMMVDSNPEKPIRLTADPLRIRQVLLNIVGNAIKFTDDGEIVIHAEEQDGRVTICVRDTGIGIPAKNHDLIFEAFGQVDTSTTRKVGGTGLGLPISRHLVSLHGGRIWVESDGIPGGGSTFYVELPVVLNPQNGFVEHSESAD